MLPEHFINQVQQATDIVDLIGQYVSLKHRGRNALGLCPFHQEKTPSFNVSPGKQMFKCFGCGAGGGAFQFVMLHQKVTFPEAVRFLAERANIPMPVESAGPAESGGLDKNLLRELMKFASEFFQKQLYSQAGKGAMEYAISRQLNKESLLRFGLGYAPDAWDALLRSARQKGYAEAQLEAAGLVVRKDNGGCYDRFRNRLIFPIADTGGRIIAFGGRALSAEDKAKYLNSPETVLFDKSSNLYGLAWAAQPISRSGQAIVVEGYFDAVMPAQAGMDNVVATLGTALTERHVRMLSRLARDVVLVFDADTAGQAAAERALELFIAQQINVRVATIPEGKDPCDYVLAAGADAFRGLIAQAPDALEYIWRRRSVELSAKGDLVGRRRAAEEFLRLVVNSAAYGAIDTVRQGLLVNRLAQVLGMPVQELAQQMRAIARTAPRTAVRMEDAGRPGQAGESYAALGGLNRARRHILEVLIAEPDQFEFAARHVGVEDFSGQALEAGDPLLAAVAREVWRLGDEGELRLENLLAIQADPAWGRLIADLAMGGEARGNHHATLAGALDKLEHHRQRQELGDLRNSPDDDNLRQLTERLRKPDPRRRPAIS